MSKPPLLPGIAAIQNQPFAVDHITIGPKFCARSLLPNIIKNFSFSNFPKNYVFKKAHRPQKGKMELLSFLCHLVFWVKLGKIKFSIRIEHLDYQNYVTKVPIS